MQACAVALQATSEAPGGDGLGALLERLRVFAPARDYQAAFDVLADAHARRALGEEVPGGEVAAAVGTGISAAEAVPAALHAALTHPGSFADAVLYAIGLGGDTYTVAAMAGALVGARLGHEAIPERWLERLESHDRLVDLADPSTTPSMPDPAPPRPPGKGVGFATRRPRQCLPRG